MGLSNSFLLTKNFLLSHKEKIQAHFRWCEIDKSGVRQARVDFQR